MKVTKIPGLGRFGVYIDDVDFNNITDEEWMEIGKIHLQSLVTIIRNTNLDSVEYHRRIMQWGTHRMISEYHITEKYLFKVPSFFKAAMNNDPAIDKIDADWLKANLHMCVRDEKGNPINVMKVTGRRLADGTPEGMFAEGELLWHSNESGNILFTPGVALLAKEGVVGSATGFLTTTDWYERQSESFRSELDEMVMVHKFTPGRINPGLRDDQDQFMYKNMCPVNDVKIPLVIRSPYGYKGLHYSVNTIDHIDGMSKAESDKLFARIDKELFTDEFIYDHWYQNNGDLCLFDNSITLHRRQGGIADRMCHRMQYDYTHIQPEPYMPYLQPEFRREYFRQANHMIKVMADTKFQLPKKTFTDYFPW